MSRPIFEVLTISLYRNQGALSARCGTCRSTQQLAIAAKLADDSGDRRGGSGCIASVDREGTANHPLQRSELLRWSFQRSPAIQYSSSHTLFLLKENTMRRDARTTRTSLMPCAVTRLSAPVAPLQPSWGRFDKRSAIHQPAMSRSCGDRKDGSGYSV